MLIECVPNFSEGRDRAIVERIARALVGVRVLDVTSDPDHNRSVITFAGEAEAVEAAAVAAAGAAVECIDLTKHQGVHPRIGAIDVIPFVPLAGAPMADCAAIAARVAQSVWNRFELPSFLYEYARADRRPLEELRRAAKGGAAPDIGVGRHSTAGAAAIGARKFLVAWNVFLETRDLELARRIARKIRFSGGGFPGVKALGLELAGRNCVQVSINSVDFEATPLWVVYEAVAEEARSAGVAVIGAELIGLAPRAAFADSGIPWMDGSEGKVLEKALIAQVPS